MSSRVSLCGDCARHPGLKKCIAANSVLGLCAFCGRSGVAVRSPDDIQPMVMLLRALIRYHWDESAYNRHWGGDSLLALFDDPNNPLLAPPASDAYLDDFDELVQWPPYPDYDKGIALYAGHNEETRLAHTAISKIVPRSIRELQERLLRENFFEVESDLDSLISSFVSDIVDTLPTESIWFRARIGHQAAYRRFTRGRWETRFQPYVGLEIGAPPPTLAAGGRLNRAGVSFLYLSSDLHTALAEVRPHPGHLVSIGGFENSEPLKFADFNPDIIAFATSDARLDQYAVVQALDRMMSFPVTPEERSRYLLTQLLAEVLMKRGLQGVRFRSSVGAGSNICVFQPARFSYVESLASLRSVTRLDYSDLAAPFLVKPDVDDHLLLG